MPLSRRKSIFTPDASLLSNISLIFVITAILVSCKPAPWSADEISLLRSLTLSTLPPLPPDPSNALADNPQAAEFGRRLFFDTRLSTTGNVSCATCHQPQRHFTDGRSKGQAIATSNRNTLSIVGSAYSPWLYWDGRKDSLWSQALGPLEDPAEHGGNRLHYVRFIASEYRTAYENLFGPLPDLSDSQRFPAAATPAHNADWQTAWQAMSPNDRHLVNQSFANIGKAIAAYERRLLPTTSRFDIYVEAMLGGGETRQQQIFSEAEVHGLRLFIGKARCIECHNGPLFTNNEFHNTGVTTSPGELPDRGRSEGLHKVIADPFNCTGPYSDQPAESCLELRFVRTGKELVGAMRTPTLRNIADTAPFMHKGQMKNLSEVLEHYNQAPAAIIGHNEAEPLGLSRQELTELEAFLQTLSGSIAADTK
jgi:cytochrome c peroxidase